jgi:hypothetical protein
MAIVSLAVSDFRISQHNMKNSFSPGKKRNAGKTINISQK